MTTTDVLDRHMRAFAERDVEAILADYSPDVVFFVPGGPLKDAGAIRNMFQELISEFSQPGCSFTLRQQHVQGDHAFIIWDAETPDNRYEFATDTFLVRDGRIVAQSFAAKIAKR